MSGEKEKKPTFWISASLEENAIWFPSYKSTKAEALEEVYREAYLNSNKENKKYLVGIVKADETSKFQYSCNGECFIDEVVSQADDEGFNVDDYLADVPEEILNELEQEITKTFLNWEKKHNLQLNGITFDTFETFEVYKESGKLITHLVDS